MLLEPPHYYFSVKALAGLIEHLNFNKLIYCINIWNLHQVNKNSLDLFIFVTIFAKGGAFTDVQFYELKDHTLTAKNTML